MQVSAKPCFWWIQTHPLRAVRLVLGLASVAVLARGDLSADSDALADLHSSDLASCLNDMAYDFYSRDQPELLKGAMKGG